MEQHRSTVRPAQIRVRLATVCVPEESAAGGVPQNLNAERAVRKDRGVCLSDEGFTLMPAYAASKEFIKGKTGAGDAFCSGALLGIYKGLSDYDILDLASQAAVASLRTADATSGVVSRKELNELCKDLGREEI